MTTSSPAMLDTNVLVYADQSQHPFHQKSKDLRDKGVRGEVGLCVCPQVLFEFFAVVTNPRRVTRPMEPSEAVIEVEKYLRAKHILKVFPGSDIVGAVVDLLGEHTIKGQAIFDLQLVATMLINGISRIYTYNDAHFRRFALLEVIVP